MRPASTFSIIQLSNSRAVWIIGGYILFNIFYRRKGIDC